MWRDNPVVERVRLAGARTDAWARRATGFGVALRAVVWASGALALYVAVGHDTPRLIPVVLLLPLVATARPDGLWVGLVLAATLIGWIATTLGQPYPSLASAVVVGVAAYTHHTSAALAAVWRADTAVSAELRRGWWRRTVVVSVAGVALAFAVLALSSSPLPVPPTALVVAGILTATAVTAAIVYLWWRR